jgi:ABC-type metal ion transport system, periplasmic component/surface antigen
MRTSYRIAALALLIGAAVVTTTFADTKASYSSSNPVTIKVLADVVPHAELLEFVKPKLAAQGINLEITISDFSRDGNEAVDQGEYDANYFEHQPYLDSVKAEKGYDLANAGNIHVEPIGFYSKKWKSLKDLPKNATFEIPNDVTNEYRALKILETAGFLKLKAGIKVGQATLRDVDKYLKPVKLVEIDAGQLVRDLPDFDGGVINTNRVLEAGIDTSTAFFREGKDSPYANIIVTKSSRVNDPAIQALVKALRSEDVRKFINDKYKGAVIPAF